MRSVILGGLVAVACTVAAAQPKVISEFTGRVVGVTDGDTAKVLVGTQTITVRLEGIDAPETGQPFGTRARQALSTLVFGKTVTVRKTGEDRYDRTLGMLIEGGKHQSTGTEHLIGRQPGRLSHVQRRTKRNTTGTEHFVKRQRTF